MSYPPPLHTPPSGNLLPYVVSQFENDLADLKDASRPLLNHLTNMAKEHVRYSREIVDAVCRRIMHLPAPMILPTFYLLDSITKNVGGVYVEAFARRVAPIFLECYERAPAALRLKLSQMLRTWPAYFGQSLVDYLFDEVNRIERTVPPPPPPDPHHTIHVNPNFFPRGDYPSNLFLRNLFFSAQFQDFLTSQINFRATQQPLPTSSVSTSASLPFSSTTFGFPSPSFS
jgi:hypothetical protein